VDLVRTINRNRNRVDVGVIANRHLGVARRDAGAAGALDDQPAVT
jgi:hypothetical protein